MVEEFAFGGGLDRHVEQDHGRAAKARSVPAQRGAGQFDARGVVGQAAGPKLRFVAGEQRGEVAGHGAAVEADFFERVGEGAREAGKAGGLAQRGQRGGGGHTRGEGFADDAPHGRQAGAAQLLAGGAVYEIAEPVTVDAGEHALADFEGDLVGRLALRGEDQDSLIGMDADELARGLTQVGVGGQTVV